MDVSRLTLSREIAKQECSQTKILRWMQAHPEKLLHTNLSLMAKSAALEGTCSLATAKAKLQQMVNNQVIYRHGKIRNANFKINYLHKDIPKDLIESAPEADQETVKRVLAQLEEDKKRTIDEVGAVITKQETPKDNTITEAQEEDQSNSSNQTISIKRSEDGEPITIQLNITININ